MFRDNFLNQQRANIAPFYDSPENFAMKKKLFLDGLHIKLVKEVKVLAYQGKTIPKKELQEIDDGAAITNISTREAYELFVKYENMLLLRNWTEGLVKDELDLLDKLLHSQQQEEIEKAGGGMVSYIGSWLGSFGGGYSAIPDPKNEMANLAKLAVPEFKQQAIGDRGSIGIDDGDDSFDENDFYDAVEEHTNQIERASVEIYNNYI